MSDGPRVRRRPNGDVELENLSPLLVVALHELPGLLDDGQPEKVRRRLFPMPTDDDEHQEEWRRLVHPDLFALVASARAVVERDLAGLTPPGPFQDGWSLRIPAAHLPGWLAALNAVRLTLSELFDIGEADMREENLFVRDDKSEAVAKIHLLGWLQQLLIESEEQ